MLKPGSAQRGFTLVELLVGIALIAVLVGLAVPAMGTYLQNAKLGSATSTLYAGVQKARLEAIRRNVSTQFVLTETALTTADIANSVVPDVAGHNWLVRAASAPGIYLPVIEAKSGAEGEASSQLPALQIMSGGAGVGPFDGTITFNGYGATNGSAYWIDITNPAAGTCASAGGTIRCRRIAVSPGGQITACDPAAPPTDSRACPP